MNRFSPVRALLPLLLAWAVSAQQPAAPVALPEGAPPGLRYIDRAELLEHATFLASDRLAGRLTGSPGQLAAAKYVAEHFEKLGLEPLGDEKTGGGRAWTQSYPLQRVYLTPDTAVELDGKKITEGFGVLAGKEAGVVDVRGPWVVVEGRSRDVPDLKGKIPLVRLKTPKLSANIQVMFSSAMSSFMRSRSIARKLAEAGAEAVAFCLDDDSCGVSTAITYSGLSPGKDLMEFEGDAGMARMASMWQAPIPQLFLSAELSKRLLAAAESDQPAAGAVHIDIERDQHAHAVNVVALLRGSDPRLRDECVIYSAHMDHVGVRLDGDVYNGADDNASGTSGLLEIAQAYAKSPKRPRRSIVFLSVSGEELGLWGSRYFSEHPTWPSEKIIADVNTDMIGRVGPESGEDEVTVTPSYHNDMFSTLVRDSAVVAEKLGTSFRNGDKYYTRSDHYNFAKLGIPVIFFCNGEHEDYHQVSDTADKLDGDKMERLARIAYWTGYMAAQADERPHTLGRCSGWEGEGR